MDASWIGEPRRNIGFTTACSVGVVRLSVFLFQFTITDGGPAGATGAACAKRWLLDVSNSKMIRTVRRVRMGVCG